MKVELKVHGKNIVSAGTGEPDDVAYWRNRAEGLERALAAIFAAAGDRGYEPGDPVDERDVVATILGARRRHLRLAGERPPA